MLQHVNSKLSSERVSPVKTLSRAECSGCDALHGRERHAGTAVRSGGARASGRTAAAPADGAVPARRSGRRAASLPPYRYFSAPAVRPATTCRWKMMYAASTGSIAITRPANRPDQSPL